MTPLELYIGIPEELCALKHTHSLYSSLTPHFTQAMNEMLRAHVLLLFLFCASANAFSTYLIEEKSEVCFYRFAEEKATLKAKVSHLHRA